MTIAYATKTDGDTYMAANRLNTSAWDSATDTQKEKALLQSSIMIDHLNYEGDLADEDQENQFPRGIDTVVPNDIVNACIELAYSLLDGVDPEKEFENQDLTSMAFSTVRTNFLRRAPMEHIMAGIPSLAAWRFLKPYLRSGTSVRLDRDS